MPQKSIRSQPAAPRRCAGELSGFTLAEVLVTLMIIGVIAAMTIPSLMQNTQQQEFKAAYKKAVSMLNQAVSLNYALDGEDATSFMGTGFYNLREKRLNVMSKDPNASSVYTADGMYFKAISGNSADDITAGGTMPTIETTGACETDGEGSKLLCANVIVDVNGVKGPNKWSTSTRGVYDYFVIGIYPQRAQANGQVFSDILYNK